MIVKEIMTAQSVKSCTPETKLSEAAKLMKTSNCGALPVVDQENKVLGIITDRDIALSLSDTETPAFDQRKVKEVMTKTVYTVKSDDEISTVFQNMRKNQIGRLPVVDSAGKLNGIVSLHNLINYTINENVKDQWDIKVPGENLVKTIHAITDRYSSQKSTSSTPTPIM